MDDNENIRLTSSSRLKPSHRTQYFAAFSAALSGLTFGTIVAYTSPAGPELQNPTSPTDGSLRLSEDEFNWFSSSVNLAGAVGALVCGYFVDHFGRRGSLLGVSAVAIVGWIVIACGPNFGTLLVGRILTGMSMGAAPVVTPAYVAEISSLDVRGTLGCAFMLFITLGNLWAYVLGAFIKSWRLLAGITAIPPTLCLISMIFAKETPLFLLMKGKRQQSMDTLQYFRGKNYDLREEFKSMQEFLEELRRNKASLRDLLLPYNLKPLSISLAVLVFVQLSGITPVLFNLLTIFQDAGTNISNDLSSIIVGLVQVAVAVVATTLIDRAGRKILLIISAVVMAISLVGLGDFFYFKEQNSEWAKSNLGWLPLTSLIAYIFAINIGFAPVQWVLMAELIPPEVKGIAGSVATMVNWIVAFIITISFIPMQNAIGMYGTYWFFTGMCVIALVFSVFVVPETKGRTMQEIASYFGNPAANKPDDPKGFTNR